MNHLPVVAVSSVVRGARKGTGHGGLYIVDLELREVRQELNWDDSSIDFAGDGGDRGLRGIEIVGDRIFVASSRAIHIFDWRFRLQQSVSSPCLGQAHEIVFREGFLWVTSTAFDSVLALNTQTLRFEFGLQIRAVAGEVEAAPFDPERESITRGDTLHLNSIALQGQDIVISGLRWPHAFRIKDGNLETDRALPLGTHNVLPTPWGWAFNDSARDQVVVERGQETEAYAVPRYPISELDGLDTANGPLARAGFARGLVLADDGVLIGGSSPSTVTAWDLGAKRAVASIRISRDVRQAVHGLALWPFD